MNKDEREVWDTVQAMNRCWTCGDLRQLEKLNDYFHDEMVAITPVDRKRIEGKRPCIAGWSNFARSTTIHFWTEKEAKIQIYGESAVVTYYYDMECDITGQRLALSGRDMLTLIHDKGRWQVVADQFSSFPENQN